MKYTISLTLVICFTTAVCAQTEKGNFLIGGTASFQATKNDDSDSKSWSLSPNISYFLANRFAVGIITPLAVSDNSSPTLLFSSNSYSIGPTIRYYFPITEQWSVFPQLDYTHQWSEVKIGVPTFAPTETKSTGNVFRINMGITYFITHNVGLEGILSYQNSNASSVGLLTSGSTYGIRFGLQIYLLRTKQESAK